MTLAEILKAHGMEDEAINKVLEAMKTNKIFTASEENLDIRYGKLKEQHTEAQSLIEELKKSNQGNEGLQSKVTEYEGKVAQLEAELNEERLNSALKVGLLEAGCKDVEYASFKLISKGDLALDENGKIKGWDDKLAALKTQLPQHFESGSGGGNGGRKYIENPLPGGGSGGNPTVTKEEFLKMGYNDRLKLKQENEQLYRQLAKN